MTTKTNVSKFVSIYLLMCTVWAIGTNLHMLLTVHVPISVMTSCISILCCVMATQYALKGYRKDAARYYKFFMIILFVFFQFRNCEITLRGQNPIDSGVSVGWVSLCAALALVLGLASDLGKKKSLTLAWIMVAVTIMVLFIEVPRNPGVIRGGDYIGTVITFRASSDCFLSQAALAMTVAKYQNKTARGTK